MDITQRKPSISTSEPIRTLSVTDGEITLLPKQAYCARLTQSSASIGFAFDAQQGQHALASSRVHNFRTQANTLAFLPAGCDVYSESEAGGEYLKFSIGNVNFPLVQHHPINGIHHTNTARAAYALRRMLLCQSPVDSFEIDELVARFTRYFRSNEPTSGLPNHRFSISRKRFIEDFIEARLPEKLTVKILANACQLSEAYFARRFKSTFTLSPHEYVIERRIARARTALQQDRQSLIDIAIDCGFSSHAHMSCVFQQRLGISPSSLR